MKIVDTGTVYAKHARLCLPVISTRLGNDDSLLTQANIDGCIVHRQIWVGLCQNAQVLYCD